jgi:hypothetical protein
MVIIIIILLIALAAIAIGLGVREDSLKKEKAKKQDDNTKI